MLVADVRKWIVDVQSCLKPSSVAVDGVEGLEYELRESQVCSCYRLTSEVSKIISCYQDEK